MKERILTVDDMVVDRKGYRAFLQDTTKVYLTQKEYDLLVTLFLFRGMTLSREKLLSMVWQYSFAGGTRTVDVHVGQLRKKLGLKERIRTVRGVGYRFEPNP